MFFFLLIPFSLFAWFLGIWHKRGNKPAKWLLLVLLFSTIPLETQGLVIFITAFFILGFIYAEETNFSRLWLRLKAGLRENTPSDRAHAAKSGSSSSSAPFSSFREPEENNNHEKKGNASEESVSWEDILKQREEKMRNYREKQAKQPHERDGS